MGHGLDQPGDVVRFSQECVNTCARKLKAVDARQIVVEDQQAVVASPVRLKPTHARSMIAGGVGRQRHTSAS